MLLSTLPDLHPSAGTYSELGIVVVSTSADPKRLKAAFAELEEQAHELGADAIIHVQTLPTHNNGGVFGHIIITGTAIKIDTRKEKPDLPIQKSRVNGKVRY